MGNNEDLPQAPGAPETEGAANPSEVVDHPEGATPSSPGYEATRQQVDAARGEVEQTTGADDQQDAGDAAPGSTDNGPDGASDQGSVS